MCSMPDSKVIVIDPEELPVFRVVHEPNRMTTGYGITDHIPNCPSCKRGTPAALGEVLSIAVFMSIVFYRI